MISTKKSALIFYDFKCFFNMKIMQKKIYIHFYKIKSIVTYGK